MAEEDYAGLAAREWLAQLKADRATIVDVAGDPVGDDEVVQELAKIIRAYVVDYSCGCMS